MVAAAACLLVPMALWAVRYALATQQRVQLLLYWAGLLAASLPGMDWLARSSGVQNILVRKVRAALLLRSWLPQILLLHSTSGCVCGEARSVQPRAPRHAPRLRRLPHAASRFKKTPPHRGSGALTPVAAGLPRAGGSPLPARAGAGALPAGCRAGHRSRSLRGRGGAARRPGEHLAALSCSLHAQGLPCSQAEAWLARRCPWWAGRCTPS